MSNNYFFYRFEGHVSSKKNNELGEILEGYHIDVFHPTLFNLSAHSSRLFIYLFWFIITKGQYKIFYVKKNDVIVHYTHVLPKFFKFPFMCSKDLEVGPAWTAESYRGKKIFPSMIIYLLKYFKEKNRNFYILIHVDNIPSQKAVMKTGFKKWGKGIKTNKLGIYKVDKYFE